MKFLKLFLPKETLLDTTIFLIPTFFIKIGFLCWWNFCFSISISSNFIIVFFCCFFFFLILIFLLYYSINNFPFWIKYCKIKYFCVIFVLLKYYQDQNLQFNYISFNFYFPFFYNILLTQICYLCCEMVLNVFVFLDTLSDNS